MSDSRQPNPRAVDYFALLVGFIAAGLEYGFILFLCLVEQAGPVDFRAPLLFVAGVLLANLALVLKFRVWWHGILSGLFFALPIASVCIYFLNPSAGLGEEHGNQLRFVAAAVVSLSVIILTIKARRQSRRSLPDETAAANCADVYLGR